MSYALDVNVLLYASDEASPHHRVARRFLEGCAANPEPLCLPWVSLMSYLRIATPPRIFAAPLSPAIAFANVERLAALPQARLLAEREGFLEVYGEVSRDLPVRGNLVPDAHLAALLRQHGVLRLYSRDSDFRKFPFLDVQDPFPA